MRFIFLMIILYFAFRAAGNLLEAVRDERGSRDTLEESRYSEADIEEAQWEDIE